uniref:DNA-directed RNA polymerase III subunit RPC6 n=1 Tax=Albugo laibachii Nc14 TaxID=890382 RepID=F0WVF3_9STRA|nr:DNAdirected RNA polymerase III subunit RPC6 putative [Albugo laibachii Nc14]CCA25467.1 DNAdirected RNA polymerase III subunit RPC6 putative [Albugo laibachii Nc14]|eukprot:CCA25467.1 DNAdirected RNA polymerase III subunit RPC6 putative [Albugo laibachii Nc14]
MALQALSTKFLTLLRNHPDSITDAQVREYFENEGSGEYEKLPPVINTLMSEGRIKLFQKGASISYAIVAQEEAERLRGLTFANSVEQRVVLSEIERAGNKGIWTRDIKMQSNIAQQVVVKTLRLLESRQLIKSVKSISSKNKILYMLFDLGTSCKHNLEVFIDITFLSVPSTEVTGGPWYNEQEFDHVFINTLCTFVYEVIKASGMSTLKAITDKVHASGISKVALGSEEIRSILQTLMYDGRIEQVRSVSLKPMNNEVNYKVTQQITTMNYLSETPCGICPVFEQCREGNVISPRSCLYITKWLDLQDGEI